MTAPPAIHAPASDVAPSRPVGERFLLLLYEDEEFAPVGSEAELVREYGEWWTNNLREPSAILWADRLDASGTIVEPGGGRPGVLETAAGTLTGFFLIAAQNGEAAVRIAAESPHLRYGGRIVVRPVD